MPVDVHGPERLWGDFPRVSVSVAGPLRRVRRARIIPGSAQRISAEEALEKLLALNLARASSAKG